VNNDRILKTGDVSKYCQKKERFRLQSVIWHYLFRNV